TMHARWGRGLKNGAVHTRPFGPAQQGFLDLTPSDPADPPRRSAMVHRRAHKMSGPTQRQLRVGELIRHALAELLTRGEVHDEILAAHVVTIPEVRMSPDLRLASVYVMPLGGKDVGPVLAALERHRRFIR